MQKESECSRSDDSRLWFRTSNLKLSDSKQTELETQ